MARETFQYIGRPRLLLLLGACILGIQESHAQQATPDPGVYESSGLPTGSPLTTDRITSGSVPRSGESTDESRPADERYAPTRDSRERDRGGSAATGAERYGKCGIGKCGGDKGDPGSYE